MPGMFYYCLWYEQGGICASGGKILKKASRNVESMQQHIESSGSMKRALSLLDKTERLWHLN
jgi:hypothetical protein